MRKFTTILTTFLLLLFSCKNTQTAHVATVSSSSPAFTNITVSEKDAVYDWSPATELLQSQNRPASNAILWSKETYIAGPIEEISQECFLEQKRKL